MSRPLNDIYKEANHESHDAGLQAVYEQGWNDAKADSAGTLVEGPTVDEKENDDA